LIGSRSATLRGSLRLVWRRVVFSVGFACSRSLWAQNGNKKGLHSRQALRGWLVLLEIFIYCFDKLGEECDNDAENHARTS
jgi:hypothetical protein